MDARLWGRRIVSKAVAARPHILALFEGEIDLARCQHILGHYLVEHVGVWDDLDSFSPSMTQNLVTVLVGHKSFKLIIESQGLSIELAHHMIAIYRFGVLVLMNAFLLSCFNFV